MSESSSSNNAGCGCVSFIATILALWALWFGLSTPWGVFHIDLFPPAIRMLQSETP